MKYVPEYASADQEKIVSYKIRISAICQIQNVVVRPSRRQSQIFHYLFIPFLLVLGEYKMSMSMYFTALF